MRFENNTIGTVADAGEDDIRRAFENRESWDNADWPGNVYTLIAPDGARLTSISGRNFRDFDLAYADAGGAWRRLQAHLTAAEVAARFVRFLNGDRAWLAAEPWEPDG